MAAFELSVNDSTTKVEVPGEMPLLWVLRVGSVRRSRGRQRGVRRDLPHFVVTGAGSLVDLPQNRGRCVFWPKLRLR